MIDPGSLEIRHEEADDRGAFYVERDARRVAEQVYRRTDAGHIVIVHTEVDSNLRGRGVARQLLEKLVAWARETRTKVSPTCRYAARQFAQDPSIRDVLAT